MKGIFWSIRQNCQTTILIWADRWPELQLCWWLADHVMRLMTCCCSPLWLFALIGQTFADGVEVNSGDGKHWSGFETEFRIRMALDRCRGWWFFSPCGEILRLTRSMILLRPIVRRLTRLMRPMRPTKQMMVSTGTVVMLMMLTRWGTCGWLKWPRLSLAGPESKHST